MAFGVMFRFPAPTPFLSRARGTRAPTDAAVAGRPPYQGFGALGERALPVGGLKDEVWEVFFF